MQFVDDFVGPRVGGEVEDDGFSAVAVADCIAFVAGSCVEV